MTNNLISKKMIYLFLSLGLIGVIAVVYFLRKEPPVVIECRQKAEKEGLFSPRWDREAEAEERFYLCLIKKNLTLINILGSGMGSQNGRASTLRVLRR